MMFLFWPTTRFRIVFSSSAAFCNCEITLFLHSHDCSYISDTLTCFKLSNCSSTIASTQMMFCRCFPFHYFWNTWYFKEISLINYCAIFLNNFTAWIFERIKSFRALLFTQITGRTVLLCRLSGTLYCKN